MAGGLILSKKCDKKDLIVGLQTGNTKHPELR
jgi:hypothetical protein